MRSQCSPPDDRLKGMLAERSANRKLAWKRDRRGLVSPRLNVYFSGNAVTANMMKSKRERVTVLPLWTGSRAAPGSVLLFLPGFSCGFVLLVAGSRSLDGPCPDYVWLASLFHFALALPK